MYMKEENKLTLDRKDKLIGGVGSGIAKYLEVDPVIVRIALLIVLFNVGLLYGAIFYGITYWLLSENEDKVNSENSYYETEGKPTPNSYYEEPEEPEEVTYEQEEFELDDIMVRGTEGLETEDELEDELEDEVNVGVNNETEEIGVEEDENEPVEVVIEEVWEEEPKTEVEEEELTSIEEETSKDGDEIS